MHRILLVAALPLFLTGCSGSSSTPREDAPPPVVAEPIPAAATQAAATSPAAATYPKNPRLHMQHHFADACVVHDTLVRGDLDAMREAAGRLASHEPLADAPEFAPELVEGMRTHAAAAQQAESLGPAVFAAGKLAVTCGECHSKSEAKVTFAQVPRPSADADDLFGHMARHAWAANRMWEGLVANDTALWNQGVNELAEPPLPIEAFGAKPPETVSKASQMVHELGASGLTAMDQAARGRVYTQLLSACSQCHTALGRGPGTVVE